MNKPSSLYIFSGLMAAIAGCAPSDVPESAAVADGESALALVGAAPTVTAIAASNSAAVALRSDGTVWSWGANNFGQLGNGDSALRRGPVQVSGLSGVTAVAAGTHHHLALESDGTVWAWGANGQGELGDGTMQGRSTPVQVSGLSGVIAIGGATLALWRSSPMGRCGPGARCAIR